MIKTTLMNMINARGHEVTLSHKVAGAYDPVTRKPISTVKSWTGKALLASVKSSEVNGTSIQSGDMRIRVPLVGFDPAPNDAAVIDGVAWNVSDVAKTYDMGQVIGYQLLVRK